MRLLRSLLRAPGFSVAAVLALSIGIGASAAFFSVINGVLLRPLPYRDQDQLVLVDVRKAGRHTIPSYQQFVDWEQRARTFDAMAYAAGEAFLLRRTAETEAVAIAMASRGFFTMLGATPLLGRVPSAAEDNAAATPVLVLSERLWRGSFGGDTTVIGRAVVTDKASFVIIGVMPAGFAFPAWASAWAPLAPLAHLVPGIQRRDWRADARAIGRLKHGVTLERAVQDLNSIAVTLALEYPTTDADSEGLLTPVISQVVGDVRRPLFLFGLAVGVVLLIACANVGTLVLVRGSARAREIAIRSALGASSARVLRLLLSESAILSFAGAALGLVLAFWIVHLLRILAPAGLSRIDEIALDWRTVSFTVAVAVAAPVIFGLAPAIHAARASTLRLGRGSSGGRLDARLRSSLLVGQVALSLVLLVCAGLLIRSFIELRALDAGFERERLLSARIQPPSSRFQSPSALLSIYDRVRAEVARIPGVERVAIVNHEGDAGVRTDVRIPGRNLEPAAEPRALFRLVSAGYFETIGQRLLRGRTLTDADMTGSSRVAVVSAHVAEQLWPGADGLGTFLRVIRQGPGRRGHGEPLEVQVVGIVADAVFQYPGGPAMNAVFLPFTIGPPDQMSLMVRAGQDPSDLVGAVRSAMLRVERDLPTTRVGVVMADTWESLAHRFDLVMLAVFGATALSLSAVGLYGVIAFVVVQRRHEIGVRRAIGATESQLKRSFVGFGLRLAGTGILLGIPLAVAGARVLRASLFGVGSLDAWTFTASAFLLLSVAALATYFPARRLSEISPLEALRAE